jgi:glycopeptide antibiotics resistance protein
MTTIGEQRPAARWFLAMAIACAIFSFYGSLLPFRFRQLSLDEAWTQFTENWSSEARASRVDFLVNAMLFAPIGFGLMGWMESRWRRPFRLLGAVLFTIAVAALLSLINEFSQVWVDGRVSSRWDILAQWIGASVGIVAWLFCGGMIERCLATFGQSRNHSGRTQRLLEVLVVAIVLVALVPFDLTIHPADLWAKYRKGMINPVPFQGTTWTSLAGVETLLKILFAIPIGMLAVIMGSPARRRFAPAVIIAVAMIGGIELAQLFVESRYSTATDVVIGAFGALIGVALERHFPISTSSVKMRDREEVGWASGLAAAYCLVLCLVMWWPLRFSIDSGMVREKLIGLAELPLNRLMMHQSALQAFSKLVERFVLYVPFGILIGSAILKSRFGKQRNSMLATASILGVVLATAIFVEIGQIFVPGRVPDPTDILLATAGGGAGLFIYRLAASRPLRST